jgi:hypothetical protein
MFSFLPFKRYAAIVCTTLAVSACSGSSSDSGTGYYQLYNASANAPKIYMSIDDTDFSGVSSGNLSSFIEADVGEQSVELSRQDDDNSYLALYSDTLKTKSDMAQLLVVTGDISSPSILTYQYEIENPDDEDEQFTFHLLDLSSSDQSIDVYLSKDDETFNEAQLLSQLSFGEFSDSQYFTSDESYRFYITYAGSDEILYQSESIYFGYTSQYIIAIRDNSGVGDSPFMIEKLSQSSYIENYPDEDSGAAFNVFNGITSNELLPNYQGYISVALQQTETSETIENLSFGSLSSTLNVPFGDYQMSITGENNQIIAKNQRLSLPANSLKTVFFYQTVEEANLADDDNTNDETKLYINALTVENSNRNSVYDHQISLINLIDDYDGVNVYFVRSDETIDTATYNSYNTIASPVTLTLLNNTYDIYVVGKEDNTDVILASSSVTLDENSGDLFLVMTTDSQTISGYNAQLIP